MGLAGQLGAGNAVPWQSMNEALVSTLSTAKQNDEQSLTPPTIG